MQATAALTHVLTCFLSIKLVLQTTYRIPAARTISTGSAQTDGIGLCNFGSLPKPQVGKDRMHQYMRCRGLDVETGNTTTFKTRTSQLPCPGLRQSGMAQQPPSKPCLEATPQISCLATSQQLDKATCLIAIVLLFD